MTAGRLGVGLIGAGPVVQAIHLPALARTEDLFEVRNIMDVDPMVAGSVADRVGAAASTSIDELLADTTVDVIAVCSPPRFHADQTIAAMRAGKRAVLCEKPLAVTRDEAATIAAVSAETGVPLLVGAMHSFDPGWTAASEYWDELQETATFIRSRIVLPPNTRFEDFATEVVNRPTPATAGSSAPRSASDAMTGAILGLAIHNLPHVRQFLPGGPAIRVRSARLIQPFGYLVTAEIGSRVVQLIGVMGSRWRPEWTFEVTSPTRTLVTSFTPSYVHAGSATTTITDNGSARIIGPFDSNGYEHEWRTLHALAMGAATSAPSLEDLIDDLSFAVDLADGAAAAVTEVAA